MRCMGWVAAMSESAVWLLCQYKAYFWQVVITKSRILEVIVSLSFVLLFRLLRFKLYSNIVYIAMHLFPSEKSIVLFELFESLVRGSKQIKGPHHYQGQAKGTRKNLYHICHHEQWDFRHLAPL